MSSSYIIQFVLYLIVAFGIFGTILMMTKERMYEFGVLLSIGMNRGILAASVWVETFLLGLLGTGSGLLASYGILYYFKYYPIQLTGDMAKTYEKFGIDPELPTSTEPEIFLLQFTIVLLVTSFLALYPGWKIWQIKVVDAMRA